jgi:hypothetical protein
MRQGAALVTIAAALAVVALSGCAAATPNGATGGAQAPASSSSTGGSAAIDVCAALPASEVSTLSGQTFASSHAVALGANISSCSYQPDSGYNWSITVYQPGATESFSDLTRDLGGASAVTAVSGIGDKAVISGVGVVAVFGKNMIEVGYPTTPDDPDRKDAYIAIAKAAIAALG